MGLPVFDKFHYEGWQRNEAVPGRGGEGACGKREVAFKVVSQCISSTVDKFIEGRNQ